MNSNSIKSFSKFISLFVYLVLVVIPNQSIAQGMCEYHYLQTRSISDQTSFLKNLNLNLNSKSNKKIVAWTKEPLPGQLDDFNNLKIITNENTEFPWALEINGTTKFLFSKFLGEGKRGVVYLNSRDQAVKVLKQIDSPRELHLQVWGNELWKSYGVKVPEIIDIDPHGNYLVLENVKGTDLRDYFKDSIITDAEKNRDLVDKVLKFKKIAKKILKDHGVYFDLRADNFKINFDGNLVFLDTAPRIDSKRSKYYLDPRETKLSDYLFLEYFIYRSHRNKGVRLDYEKELYLQALSPVERLRSIIDKSESFAKSSEHLAEAFTFDLNKDSIKELFALTLELWTQEKSEELLSLINSMQNDKIQFLEKINYLKKFRGYLKRMRSIYVILSKNHEAPKALDQLVTDLGKFRDGIKRNDLIEASQYLNSIMSKKSEYESHEFIEKIGKFKLEKSSNLNEVFLEIKNELLNNSKKEKITPKHFHEIRKSISNLLAVAEVQYAIKPSFRNFSLVSYLRNLSNKTGDWHDLFVLSGVQITESYRKDEITLPEDIRNDFYELAQKMVF